MPDEPEQQALPPMVEEYLKRISRRIRPRYARPDVLAELRDHFADALDNAPPGKDREKLAADLLADFGDEKLLSRLIKRSKKRCRPLWVKFIIRTCQTILILLLACAGYTWWFVSGQPTISVDYLAQLNQAVRPAADESLNAAPYYLKAIELCADRKQMRDDWASVSPSSPGYAYTDQERKVLTKWIQMNQPALEQLHLGAAKPYYWLQYDAGSEGMLIFIRIPPLQNFQELSRMLCWQMYFAAEKGDWGKVEADLRDLKSLARHLMGCPTVIEQLVGMSIDELASEQLLYILMVKPPSKEVLGRLDAVLAQSFPGGYPIADLSTETLFLLDAIQHLFTDDGCGDGHLIPSRAATFLSKYTMSILASGYSLPEPFGAPPAFILRAIIQPSRRETVQIIEQWQKMKERRRSMTPYEDHVSGQPIDDQITKLLKDNPRNLFARQLLPAHQRAVWYSYVQQARHDAARTVVALLRYKDAHGQFPQTLEALVPQYLPAVPGDPFGPGPLSYKRQTDDFVLYSWGFNFQDDGGQHNKDAFRQPSSPSDYVFWPPEPPKRPEPENPRRGVIAAP